MRLRPTIDVSNTEKLTYDLVYVTTPDTLQESIEWLKTVDDFALDFETSGLDPKKDKIATIQVGNPTGSNPIAFVVDIRCFTSEQLEPFLQEAFNSKKSKLGQNIKFECKFALGNLDRNIWNVRDTQLNEMILRAGLLPLAASTGEESGRAAYGATSMAALAKRHLGLSISKDFELRTGFYKTPPGEHSEEQLLYAAGDVIYVYYIEKEQRDELIDRALVSVAKIEYGVIPILALAEHTGMGIDIRKWLTLWQEASAGRIAAEKELHRLILAADQLELVTEATSAYQVLNPKTGKALNFDSPPQVKYALEVYCKKINWPVTLVTTDPQLARLKKEYGGDFLRKNPSKSLADVPDYVIPEDKYCLLMSTKAEVLRLARLKKQLPAEFVAKLLEYSKYQIRETTFGKEFLNKHLKESQRIHSEFHQAITSTGRLSASPNLMNIPNDPRYRASFIPAPGYKFVIADYSQIEPRLSAQESQDPVYLQTFKSFDDIYLMACEAMRGYRPDKNTPEGAMDRQIFKVIVLAMAYRMGPPKLQRQLALALEAEILEGKAKFPSFDEVCNLHRTFLSTFSNLHDFQNKCSTLADPNPKTGSPRTIWDKYLGAEVTWISALCGRKRFFSQASTNTYTEAANAPIQGCSATITKAAMVLIQREIFRHGFDCVMVNVVHDEIVYECREDQAEAFAKIMKECMEKAGQFYMPDVPVLAEFPKGSNGAVSCWTKAVDKNG